MDPPKIRAVTLIHQEGVIALIAVIGLSFGEREIFQALAPKTTLLGSLSAGVSAGMATVGLLWLLRRIPALERLEHWQREVVSGWTVTDAVAVALVSGLAEEALLRALLQPVIGLVPAAVLFAVLHFVPDRLLWFWPVFALLSGFLLGGLFEVWGYPAAAAAHILINAVALLRLRRLGADQAP
jgi:CAAX protease family protein